MADVGRTRVLLGAGMLFALLVVPVALAGAAGGSDGPEANASASANKKIKKLTGRVGDLEQQLADLEAEQGGARPPSGAAGGDLTGSFPGPLIAGDAVNSAKVANDSLAALDIANPTRSVNLPLGSFTNDDDAATIDFTASDGTAPDFGYFGAAGFGIEWDSTATGAADKEFVTSTFVVPPDYASGGSYALRVSKDAHTGGVPERLRCFGLNNGIGAAADNATTTTAALTTYTLTRCPRRRTRPATWPGRSVGWMTGPVETPPTTSSRSTASSSATRRRSSGAPMPVAASRARLASGWRRER